MADDELRRLERSTDPADLTRLAQALTRAGRAEEALDAAVRALVVSPREAPTLRHLLPVARPTVEASEDGTCSVPWRGLRSFSQAKGVYLPGRHQHRGPTRLIDAGAGFVLVSYANGLAGLDLLRRTFVWNTEEVLTPLFTTRDGVVVDSGDGLRLVDPATGERRAYQAPVDQDCEVARVDDELFVAVRATGLTPFDPRTGEALTTIPLPARPRNLVTDPTGFTLQLEDATWSYDRSGQPRWWNEDATSPIGSCDGRVLLAGIGETPVVSAETGEVVRTLDAFSLDPILVTRGAVIIVGVELWAFDRVTLDRLWRVPVDPYLAFASTADTVIERGEEGVRALSADDGAELTRVSLGSRRAGLMLPCAGRLVFPASHRAGVIVVE